MGLTFISAGAGSGKTWRLTDLLHQKLVDGSVGAGGVIATTFTRKAASELRERVREHLLAKGRLDLANAMGEALIGTVNGVCQSLLQRFCFEAGLSPDLRVLDDKEAPVLLSEALEQALTLGTIAQMNRLATRLGVEDWQQTVRSLVDQIRANSVDAADLPAMAARNITDLLENFPAPGSRNLSADAREIIDRTLPKIGKAAATSTVKKTQSYISDLEGFRKALGGDQCPWSAWVKQASACPEKGLSASCEPIADIVGQYMAHPQLHQDLTDFISVGFEVASRVLRHYADRKRELGALDYADQESLLLHILDQPTIAQTLRDELDLLLVDEFQDTSPVQLALFMKLTQLAKQTYWVGDVKQAIYGFRGSDSALMASVVEALPQLGGKTEILGHSWRSRPSLVSLVNEVFVPAFSATLAADQVRLSPKRKEIGDASAFETWHMDGANVAARMAALAGQIKALVASAHPVADRATQVVRPVCLGDIAVLCRSGDRIGQVLSALAEQGIAASTSQAGLLQRPECRLALACLRRLNDAGDTIATAEIMSLADCIEPELWLTDRLEYLRQGGAKAQWKEIGDFAHPLVSLIGTLREQLPVLSPREALMRVVVGCDLSSRIVQWCRSDLEARQRLVNLDALLSLSERYEEVMRTTGRPGSVSGLIIWLASQAADEADAQPTLSINAVNVLTHHAAKGLEWPVVILLDLECAIRDRLWGVGAESAGAMDIHAPLKNRFIRFRPWPFGLTQKTALADRISSSAVGIDARRAAVDEERRLLYVSMTRARDLMVFALPKLAWDNACWMSVTGASWLLSGTEAGKGALPSKLHIPSVVRIAKAVGADTPSRLRRPKLRWFAAVQNSSSRLPLFVSPSAAEPMQCEVIETTNFGEGLNIAAGFDRADVGVAIHAAIAASVGPSGPLDETQIEQLLLRHGTQGCLDPRDLRQFVVGLSAELRSRWPEGVVTAEMPVCYRQENGQILSGQIDLLVESRSERIILDHKTGAIGRLGEVAAAQSFAGQLDCYARITYGLKPATNIRLGMVFSEKGSLTTIALSAH